MDVAEKIRQFNKKSYLVFSTGHLEYSAIAYQYKTFDYITKPLTIEKLNATIQRIFEDIKSRFYLIRIGNTSTYVNEAEIQYIQKEGMKLIYKTPERCFESYSSFNKISSSLPPHFIRCHKSYIVNLSKISYFELNKNLIQFSNGETCSIGPKYKNNFMEVIQSHVVNTNDKICSQKKMESIPIP